MKKLICCLLCFTHYVGAEIVTQDQPGQLPDDPAELYLDLMNKCLTNTIYEDENVFPNLPGKFDLQKRENGRDWPSIAHTMIGKKRMDNILFCAKQVLKNDIPGDFVETGVWRGGATIFMRAILKAYADKSRKVWVADSFAGLPPPNPKDYPADKGCNFNECKYLAISLDNVKSNFAKYGLLDNQVIFLKGFFSETLPTAPIETISLLRLDGDLYESTMDALTNLYPKLSIGGYIIIDDYGVLLPCKKAVQDYRKAYNIKDIIVPIDGDGVYWQKTE